MRALIFALALTLFLTANSSSLVITKDLNILKKYPDIKRNLSFLNGLSVSLLGFREGKYNWYMLLVTNTKAPSGPFWFLPHDNENSAFDSAIYATRKYGGGFLSILSGGLRYHEGQDPNRNFSLSSSKVASCQFQKGASSIYTATIMQIINSHKAPNMPYLALHNNTNRGSVSILRNSKSTKSFLAYSKAKILKGRGLSDEDSLVYIAGASPNAPIQKVQKLLNVGLNTKYEYVNSTNNDCSMSNFLVTQNLDNYYNIEAQHKKSGVQKEMIDRLIKVIMSSK
jgi:hypothetical protein